MGIKDLLCLKMNLRSGPFKRCREPQITVLLFETVRATYSKFWLGRIQLLFLAFYNLCIHPQ